MKKVTKNHAERRKSEASGAGWAYELKPQAFKAKKAFEGANKEFRCPLDSCDKSFRKSNGLDAHMRHYHPDYHEEESSFSPQTINLQLRNKIKFLLEQRRKIILKLTQICVFQK